MSAAEELERARRTYAAGKAQRDGSKLTDGLTRGGANQSAGAGGPR